MAEPTLISCAAECTVRIVHELSLPPLQLTLEEGAKIAAAIVGVWLVGWVVRQLIRLINVPGSPDEKEEST